MKGRVHAGHADAAVLPRRSGRAERFIVLHAQWGIFIGQLMGMGLWSRQQAAGMKDAATFPSRDAAERAMAAWSGDDASTEVFEIRGVRLMPGQTRASVDDLRMSGVRNADLAQLLEDTSFEDAMDRDAQRYGLGRLCVH